MNFLIHPVCEMTIVRCNSYRSAFIGSASFPFSKAFRLRTALDVAWQQAYAFPIGEWPVRMVRVEVCGVLWWLHPLHEKRHTLALILFLHARPVLRPYGGGGPYCILLLEVLICLITKKSLTLKDRRETGPNPLCCLEKTIIFSQTVWYGKPLLA